MSKTAEYLLKSVQQDDNNWQQQLIMRALAELLLDRPPTVEFDLVRHLKRQIEFSRTTFGPGLRTKGVLDHIRKELTEIEKKPDDLEEWIDVILLACDGAWRHGHTAESIAAALGGKLTKNMSRQWPDWRAAEPDKAIEHVRSRE